MKFKLVLLVVILGLLGGAGYGVRTYLSHNSPAAKAEVLESQGKLREALVELRNASRENPKDGQLHVRIGLLQSKLADPVAAEREFRLAIQLGADRAVVSPELGESILVQGRFRDVLQEVRANGPTPAIVARDLLLRAVAQLSLADTDAAQATLDDARARAPNQAETFLIAARVAAARNDLPEMRKEVAEVLRRDPNQVEALLIQEKLHVMDGDRTAALASADQAVKAAPWSAMARIDRASQLMLAGDDAKAQSDVNAVLQAQPRFMDAVYLKGILMARRGDYTEAASELGKLDTVSGRLPQGLYFQSLIAMQQGNLQTSSDFARRYNALVPTDPDGMRQVARTELALGQPTVAMPILTKLTTMLPKDAEGFDMLGRAAAALNRGPEAAKALETAASLAPNDIPIRFHVGAQQLQTGRAREAVATLESAFKADPKIAGLGANLVEAYLSVGDFDKADATIAAVRAATGETDELVLLAALTKMREGDLPAARTMLTEAIRKYPGALDLRTQLALVLIQEHREAEALPILTAVLAKEPAKLSALSAYIDLELAGKDLPTAIQALETAHRAAPADGVVTSMLADGLIANKDPKGALDMIRSTGPDSALPQLVSGALGRAQLALNRPEAAEATYRGVLARHPDNLAIRGALAALLSDNKDYAGVQATLQEALAGAPDNFTLLSGLVANEARWKGMDAGAKLADDLRDRPGSPPSAGELKGDLYMAANRPADAATAYEANYTKAPTPSLLLKATAAMALSNQLDSATRLLSGWLTTHPTDFVAAQRLAQIDIQAGRWKDAETHLGIVLEARPHNATALNNLAWSYFMDKDPRALAAAQRAYLQDPSPLAADTLGWILVKGGSTKAAVPLLQRAVDQRPERSIQYHLAVALAGEGRQADALRLLQPLIDGPAFGEQADARALAATFKPK